MASIETNMISICKPNGLIGKSLYSDRKAINLCFAFILYLNGCVWQMGLWLPANIVGRGNLTIYALNQMAYGTYVLSVVWNRKKYIDCFNYFERRAQIDTLCPSVASYSKKHRFIITVGSPLLFAIFFGNGFLHAYRFNVDDLYNYQKICIFAIRAFGFTAYFACHGFFIEIFIYIQSCFLQVEHQILQLLNKSGTLTMDEVRQVRHLYCIAIENTEKINSLSMPVISLYFVDSFFETHFPFLQTIASPSIYNVLILIGNTFNFSFLVYHMIYINHLATRIYEKVYSFSFRTDSLIINKEIQIFLARIARADIGLTFLDIFVITPTIATSLATISLTIALAAPTLTNYFKN